MAGFNLADGYRAAGLAATAEALKARQASFDKMRDSIDPAIAIDVVRLYFGLPVPRGTDWFRDSFGAADPTFSLIDNAREVSVLAAGLLEAAASDGKLYASLAILTAAAGGSREPVARPELIDAMRYAIEEKAIESRQQQPANPKQITLPAASKLIEELTALTQAPEVGKASALLKQVSEESAAITTSLSKQVFAVIHPLAAQILTLREEVEMLWWYIGGWSRILGKPFAGLDIGLAAVLAGIDMADMSRSAVGPAAAPAVLQRVLTTGRKSIPSKIAVTDAVDALPEDDFDCLALGEKLAVVPDICPVLTAFAKAGEIGRGTAWHTSFAKVTGLGAKITFSPLELAMQAFRERLILRALG